MIAKIEIGQCWESGNHARTFIITAINDHIVYGIDSYTGQTASFTKVNDEGMGFVSSWVLIKSNCKIKLKKVIPNIPLDPSLPILQAGHLQDRQRKRFRQEKIK